MEPKRFRISQDGNEYAMAIKLLGERVKLECVDSSVPGAPIYCRTYTVDELASESRFFQMVPRSKPQSTAEHTPSMNSPVNPDSSKWSPEVTKLKLNS